MTEMLKKYMAFSLGAAAMTADRIRQFTDEMVKRGEMSQDDAKSFTERVVSRGEEEGRSWMEWMRDQVGAADSSRVEQLERRVLLLEQQVALLEQRLATLQGPATVGETVSYGGENT